jgi:hypothetical protein
MRVPACAPPCRSWDWGGGRTRGTPPASPAVGGDAQGGRPPPPPRSGGTHKVSIAVAKPRQDPRASGRRPQRPPQLLRAGGLGGATTPANGWGGHAPRRLPPLRGGKAMPQHPPHPLDAPLRGASRGVVWCVKTKTVIPKCNYNSVVVDLDACASNFGSGAATRPAGPPKRGAPLEHAPCPPLGGTSTPPAGGGTNECPLWGPPQEARPPSHKH